MPAAHYWIWIEGQQAGPFSLQQIMRMAKPIEIDPEFPDEDCSPEITRETLFWSPTLGDWQALKYMPEEWDREDDNRDREQERRRFGAQWAEYLGGNCAFCRQLDKTVVPLSEVTRIPPDGCTCTPWSGAEWLARHSPS